jgi:hypothetical protein
LALSGTETVERDGALGADGLMNWISTLDCADVAGATALP